MMVKNGFTFFTIRHMNAWGWRVHGGRTNVPGDVDLLKMRKIGRTRPLDLIYRISYSVLLSGSKAQ